MPEPEFSIQEIVVATRDVAKAAATYGEALGADVDQRVEYPQEGIGIEMTGVWVGDFRIAFVGDTTGKGHVARSIEKRGEGLFELCIQTNDLQAAIAKMKAAGLRFTSEEPHVLRDYEWRGDVYSEVRVVFVHPGSSTGVQIELQEWVK
ncbi:MAG: VOC family protein [Actinobacteria bacterium]|nr:VOC family protein [Actinomycetota bacterium]